MTRYRSSLLVASAALLGAMVVGACSSASEPAPESVQTTRDPNERVFMVLTTGGFTSAGDRLSDFPTFVLFGDGRLFTSEFDRTRPPAVPPVEIRRITQEGIDAMVAGARQVRLDEPEDEFGFPGITDVATTYFTLRTEGKESLSSVYALGFTTPGAPVDEEVWQRRLDVQSFHQRMFEPEEWLPEGSVGEAEEYSPDGYLLFTDHVGNLGDLPPGEPPPPAWPAGLSEGSPVPGPEGSDTTCALVTPAEAQRLIDGTTEGSPPTWRLGDRIIGAYLRPLLPDEADCASVVAARPA